MSLATGKLPDCGWCGATMIQFFAEHTPTGGFLVGFECPRCYATYFECAPKDDKWNEFFVKVQKAQLQFYEDATGETKRQ